MPFRGFACFMLLVLAIPSFADDREKAQKELNQVTAMARDFTGRTVVNLTISQTTSIPRQQLVQQRIDAGLNYGSLFLATELVKSGTTMQEITAQLKAGKKISEIASSQNVNWKQIAEDGKKLNAAIDTNLYNYFLGKKAGNADPTDKYDVHYDGVKADADDANEKDIANAQKRYLTYKDRAALAQRDDKKLGLGDERIGYADHTGGPGASGTGTAAGSGPGGTANTNSGVSVPGFGGPQ